MASASVTSFSFFLAGLRSGATFVAALGSAGLLAQFAGAPAILIALVATLMAAGMAFVSAARNPFDSDHFTLGQLSTDLMSFLTAMIGLWGVVKILPALGGFVCEPLVPWNFSIAIFGAFVMSWLSAGLRIRKADAWCGVALYMAFFWISPFYGFFRAPWLLAQTVAVPCDGRPVLQALAVVLSMAVATIAGRRVSTWMTG